MAFEFDRERVPLGIDALDRQLGGGLPPGSVLAYCAPPASQSELLLYELTAQRPTYYLTTDRTEEAVGDALGRAGCPTGEPEIMHVPADAPIQHASRLFGTVGEEMNLVIDPVDALERADRGQYQAFLNELQNHMVNTGSIAVLHCLRSEDAPSLRPTTQHMTDVVFELERRVAGTEIENRLAIPKFRGGEAPGETIKLELGTRVRVDTSRDIA